MTRYLTIRHPVGMSEQNADVSTFIERVSGYAGHCEY
jgi:hypothetical protein